MPHCKEIVCKVKNAKYGLIDTKIALFCATHGKINLIWLMLNIQDVKKKVVNH